MALQLAFSGARQLAFSGASLASSLLVLATNSFNPFIYFRF
jgi:hypothetical protein